MAGMALGWPQIQVKVAAPAPRPRNIPKAKFRAGTSNTLSPTYKTIGSIPRDCKSLNVEAMEAAKCNRFVTAQIDGRVLRNIADQFRAILLSSILLII
jgi:hypothetical protein